MKFTEENSSQNANIATRTQAQTIQPIQQTTHRSYITPDQEVPSKFPYWCVRRTQDIIFSLLALIILSPLLLITALAIVIDDPEAGPIFTQERVGRRGKHFKIYKFRSMVPNAEKKLDQLLAQNQRQGPAFKLHNDPRVTRVGRVIRRLCIDELPQLVNILKGDMSIVGPRPALPRETEQYTDYEWQRFYATPGLTCYWQIHPDRDSLSFDDWVELDIKYMRERTFLIDWKIIFRTIKVVISRKGD